MPAFTPPGQCPACGEWIPRHATACDCCGANPRTGWLPQNEVYDGLDLPDDDFNYDEFVENEFGKGGKKESNRRFWWWVAVLLVIALGYGLLVPMWR
ncbi:MAG: hypothetical protein JWO94_2054 [Verrucomicrobiaceae bacterium]|nr:hypothetical protein [Verrucomicrobiaceae bacterium]